MEICADIQEEFRRFDGKHKMDFDSFIEEEVASKSIKLLQKQPPKDLYDKDKISVSFDDESIISRAVKHDSSTKSLFEGYFKVIQKFLEDLYFDNKGDVNMLSEFYEFEKFHHSMDASFLQIWEILNNVFENIDYGNIRQYEDEPQALKSKL